MGDNAAGIPSLLSGRRKTYKPKQAGPREPRLFIVGNPSACRGLPALLARDVVLGRALHSVRAVPVDRHWRVATAIAFDRY